MPCWSRCTADLPGSCSKAQCELRWLYPLPNGMQWVKALVELDGQAQASVSLPTHANAHLLQTGHLNMLYMRAGGGDEQARGLDAQGSQGR